MIITLEQTINIEDFHHNQFAYVQARKLRKNIKKLFLRLY